MLGLRKPLDQVHVMVSRGELMIRAGREQRVNGFTACLLGIAGYLNPSTLPTWGVGSLLPGHLRRVTHLGHLRSLRLCPWDDSCFQRGESRW